MTREEAIVSLGLDTTSLKTKMASFASDFRGSLNNFARQWGAAFSVGGIVAGINNILNKFDDLNDKAENLTISPQFLQAMEHIAKKDAVGGVQTFDKAITELAVRLGELKEGGEGFSDTAKKFERWGISVQQLASLNAEETFYVIADAIKSIPDPATRSAAAFDLLGKSGKGMAGILAGGADEIKKMVAATETLDNATVKALAKAKDDLEDVGNTATIWGGRLVAFIGNFSKAVGEVSTGLATVRKSIAEQTREQLDKDRKAIDDKVNAEIDAENKILAAKQAAAANQAEFQEERTPTQLKEKADLQLKIANLAFDELSAREQIKTLEAEIKKDERERSYYDKDTLGFLKLDVKIREDRLKLARMLADEEKRAGSELEKQKETSARIKSLKSQMRDEFMPTLDELAEQGIYSQDAQRLKFLERDIPDAIRWGDKKGEEQGRKEAQEIRDRLTKAGVYKDPNQGVIDELVKLTTPIEQKGGLPIIPRMTR